MAFINNNKIACLGAGYVGGPTMTVIAAQCPDIEVTVADVSEQRIALWNSDTLPIYEPGLKELVQACRGKNLYFSTDVATAVRDCSIIFIAVNTPTKTYGIGKGAAADLSTIERCTRCIAHHADSAKIIVEKSTVPVKTANAIKAILDANKKPGVEFHILSNPEFLAEGTAIKDLMNSDRVLIGGDNDMAVKVLEDLYARWIPANRIIKMSVSSAELSKLFANAFLAQRISSVNAASALCEKTGGDINEVSKAIGMDSRLGSRYLEASVGFGGSCFKKDILNLVYLCESHGLEPAASYWRGIIVMNDWQKERFALSIISTMFSTLSLKKIAILGFAYKKNTADTRDTPAANVCQSLLNERAHLYVYDPKVKRDNALSELKLTMAEDFDFDNNFFFADTLEEACNDAHAIVVLTDWDIFKELDYTSLYNNMKRPAFFFDGRRITEIEKLKHIGFRVYSIGNSNLG